MKRQRDTHLSYFSMRDYTLYARKCWQGTEWVNITWGALNAKNAFSLAQKTQFLLARFKDADISSNASVSIYIYIYNVSRLWWWHVRDLGNVKMVAEWQIYIHFNHDIQYWLLYIAGYMTHDLQVPPLSHLSLENVFISSSLGQGRK